MLPDMPNKTGLRQSYQVQFGGLNHRKGAADGEIYDMRNMTSDHYPVLSPREKRRVLLDDTLLLGLYSYGEHLFYIAFAEDGYYLYLNGERIMKVDVSDPQQMDVVAQKLVIFPAKMFFDLNALKAEAVFDTYEELEAVTDVYNGVVFVAAGNIYYWNVDRWVKTGPVYGSMEATIGPVAVQFRSGELNGSPVMNNELRFVNVGGTRIEDLFRPGDAVEIIGATVRTANNKTAIIREVSKTGRLEFSPDTFVMEEEFYTYKTTELLTFRNEGASTSVSRAFAFRHQDQIVTFSAGEGIPKDYTLEWYVGEENLSYYAPDSTEAEGTRNVKVYEKDDILSVRPTFLEFTPHYKDVLAEDSVTVRRLIPEFDHILSVNNRLWGAKGDEVFGSKLGDPFNFNYFDGISLDSYSTQLGSAGEITAVANYNGYPTFFKENEIFKLYGAYPSAFQMYATSASGVKKGCGGSIAKIGDALYYVSKNGVMAYAGGIPSYIGEALGVHIDTAVGGADGRKYYLSAMDTDGEARLYVYDTYYGLWHIEDELYATFMTYGSEMVCGRHIAGSYGNIIAFRPDGDGQQEGDIEWMVRFADAVVGSPNKKGVQQAQVRAACYDGGYCDVFVVFDGKAEIYMGRIEESGKYTSVLPIILNRGDHFAIILRGRGIVDVYGLSYKYYHGSEMR